MKIAILGFGAVGRRLAQLLAHAGHAITVGLRHPPDDPVAFSATSFAGAVRDCEAPVLALPFQACRSVLPELASTLAGKVVIDVTNPLNEDWSPLRLGEGNSAGEEIQRLLPQARVVKAFNTIFADVMRPDRQDRNGLRITAFVCGDDAQAKAAVLQLAGQAGFHAVDAGPLSTSQHLESLAHLNIHLAVAQAGGTNAAFLYRRQ